MLKKLLFITIIVVILIAWLGGIWSVNISPFSITIANPEKNFLKKAAQKVKNIIYREAGEHNPSGDVLPDQIDDKIREEIKEKLN